MPKSQAVLKRTVWYPEAAMVKQWTPVYPGPACPRDLGEVGFNCRSLGAECLPGTLSLGLREAKVKCSHLWMWTSDTATIGIKWIFFFYGFYLVQLGRSRLSQKHGGRSILYVGQNGLQGKNLSSVSMLETSVASGGFELIISLPHFFTLLFTFITPPV